jgi:seryl-tRNA synthetase
MLASRLRSFSTRRQGCSTSASTRLSTLYLSGSEGTTNPAFVIADIDDAEDRLDVDRQEMERNLKVRGIESIRVEEMSEKFARLRAVTSEYEKLCAERAVLALKFKDTPEAEVVAAKKRIEPLKDEQRQLGSEKYELEKSAVLPFLLDLPNTLHPRTPAHENQRLPNKGSRLSAPPDWSFDTQDHISLAADELDFCPASSDAAYYLFGRLAQLEMTLGWRAQDHLLGTGKYGMISGPDTVKSIVLEGCGVDCHSELAMAPMKEIKDKDSGHGQFLVGSASLYSLVAHWSKNVITRPSVLPLSFFSLGRRYRPRPTSEHPVNLFTTQQSTAVELLTVCDNLDSAELQVQAMIDTIVQFYDDLGVHFQLMAVAAPGLNKAERHRVSVRMKSSSRGTGVDKDGYVEVGCVSDYGTYISRRLMLKSEYNQADMRNLHVVGGTLIDVNKFIGCLVENSQRRDETYDLNNL